MIIGPYFVRGLLGVLLIVAAVVALSETTTRARSQSKELGTGLRESTAFMGRDEQRVTSSFSDAKASAVMGKVELDLRQATIEGEEATIEVGVVMGKVELRIPSNWTVVKRDLDVLMGKVEDHTRSSGVEAAKRLVLKGGIVMGGLEVSN